MPEILFHRIVILCGLLTAGSVAASENVIAIKAKDFQNNRGHAVAKLFREGDDVLGRGRWEVTAPIDKGNATLLFLEPPPGDYAIVVFHDENDNGLIDHNVFRFPSEALGFSNSFRPGLLNGMPSFEKLRFHHAMELQHLEINVK